MKNRIEQLDSIRGIAAFCVLVSHAISLIPLAVPIDKALKATGITNAHGAVMLFFVLSGFVLSIPFLSAYKVDYPSFLIKRLFRIYLPYVVSITLAIILSQIFLAKKIGNISGYIDSQWKSPLTSKLIVEHIYLVGNIHADAFNGVIWTLIHELRIALIFPFIVLLVKRINWKLSILICFALTSLKALDIVFKIEKSNGFHISYIDTLSYISIFILGVILAKHRVELVNYFQKLKLKYKILFFIFSILLFNFSGLAIYDIYEVTKLHPFTEFSLIIQEYGMGLGAVGLFIVAIGSTKAVKILMYKPIHFIGKISFSLYLYHPIVLLSFVHLFYYILPLWVIFLLTIAFSILIAYIAWKFVEVPCMQLGRKLVNQRRTIQPHKIMTENH
ncbi:acyltransferase family protein [Gottfriedia sp. NPDC056225]|uniref:acyltransferase family protein n=1 Tax=Gottfriedia sp. NPDC056225 TaxID=3345751 RepID=UPI001558956C|nr:acyltransferase [Arthrobacter citreus]